MSAVQTKAGTSPERAEKLARRRAKLRVNNLSISIMILIEYGLGLGVNLYAEVPKSDQGGGPFTALGRALSHSPVILALHAGFGLLFIIAGIVVLVMSIRARHVAAIVLSSIGLLALLSAGFSGSTFVNEGKDYASFSMGILAGVALLCYLVNLFILRPMPRK